MAVLSKDLVGHTLTFYMKIAFISGNTDIDTWAKPVRVNNEMAKCVLRSKTAQW